VSRGSGERDSDERGGHERASHERVSDERVSHERVSHERVSDERVSHERASHDRASHEIVQTRGGAAAMRSLADGEVMHPGVGPLVEAEQLYVRQSRLRARLLAGEGGRVDRLVLFDVGLGAGSNALAARSVSEELPESAARLELVSFERDLGALELALAAGEPFGWRGEAADAARALLAHDAHETARTRWRLVRGDLPETLARQTLRADIIYWDPVSPRANPSLWTVAALSEARRAAGPRCALYTYSASTATRLALLLSGWAVGVGDAIGDKAQTTAAAVAVSDLARPLDRGWLARLSRPDVPLPSDAPPDAIARARLAPQFGEGSERVSR
jgi:queuine tRNA-ribosyltransferase